MARRRLYATGGFVAAGLLGGALALVGAAALGIGGTTTTVEQVGGGAVGGSPASFERSRGGAFSINDIFRRDAPGVVQVTSTQVVSVHPLFRFGPQTQTGKALGSGFVMDKAGHVITNYHVVANARPVEVSFSTRDNMTAKVVG